MAQVWLTFEEIQDLFGCDAADARRRVIANQWERRRCTDGLFRAQLPPEAAHEFMLRYRSRQEPPAADSSNLTSKLTRNLESNFEAAMAALRQVFAEGAAENLSGASEATATVKHVAWPRPSRDLVFANTATTARGH